MLSCKQATKIYLKSLDGKISLREKFNLVMHVIICRACRQFRVQVLFIKKTVNILSNKQQNNTSITLNPKIKEEIIRQINSTSSNHTNNQ